MCDLNLLKHGQVFFIESYLRPFQEKAKLYPEFVQRFWLFTTVGENRSQNEKKVRIWRLEEWEILSLHEKFDRTYKAPGTMNKRLAIPQNNHPVFIFFLNEACHMTTTGIRQTKTNLEFAFVNEDYIYMLHIRFW